ncbi:MAG: 50S ribosomal protein L29 [Minisyncoccia bacterium]
MDYKTATTEELQQFVAEKRKELVDLRFGAAGSKNRNVKLPRTIRKDIARALTEVSAKRRGQQDGDASGVRA